MAEATFKPKNGISFKDVVDGDGAEFEISDVKDEGDSDFDEAETEGTFSREEVFKNLSYLCNDTGSDDEDSEEFTSPFQRLSRKMQSVTEDGGVMKMVLQPGSGCQVPATAVVRVHYNAYLELSDEPFDSTRLRKRIEEFRLGEVKPGEYYSGETIPGISIAVSSMKKGELSRFLIKPEYAYGLKGCPPRIPPDATLMYEIELLSFVENLGAEEIKHLSIEERRNLTWAKVKEASMVSKKEAFNFFKEKAFHKAKQKYLKAINILEEYRLKDDNEEKEQQKILLKLYLNTSLCFLNMKKYKPVITFAKRALEIENRNVKAFYTIGKAFHGLGDFDNSLTYLKRAQRIRPNCAEIGEELRKLDISIEKFRICEKDMYKKMFSKPSGDVDNTPDSSETPITSPESFDDFRNMIKGKLMTMKDDSDMDEMPFPNIALNPAQMAFIWEMAEDMGFEVFKKADAPGSGLFIKKK